MAPTPAEEEEEEEGGGGAQQTDRWIGRQAPAVWRATRPLALWWKVACEVR
jgi:hypothetical protein